MEKVFEIILIIFEIYLGCGIFFAIYFLSKGIHKLDGGAHGSSLSFRLLIAAGVIVFWIYLLKKIISKPLPDEVQNPD